jgi:hypothetical protein
MLLTGLLVYLIRKATKAHARSKSLKDNLVSNLGQHPQPGA